MTTSYQMLDLLEKLVVNTRPNPNNHTPHPLMLETINVLEPFVATSFAARNKLVSVRQYTELLFDSERCARLGGAEKVREYLLHDIGILRSLIRLY